MKRSYFSRAILLVLSGVLADMVLLFTLSASAGPRLSPMTFSPASCGYG